MGLGRLELKCNLLYQMMGASTFLNNLLQFPKDTINEEMAELLLPYLNMEDFNLESAKKVCGNVAGLCSWVIAMYSFYGVNKEVLPLKVILATTDFYRSSNSQNMNREQVVIYYLNFFITSTT